MKIIWNYDDIDKHILSVYIEKECIGYFLLDNDSFFRIIEDPQSSTGINIVILKQIVDEYPDALHEANKMIKQ